MFDYKEIHQECYEQLVEDLGREPTHLEIDIMYRDRMDSAKEALTLWRDNELGLVYKYLESSLTFGSDNEWIADMVEGEYEKFLECQCDPVPKSKIKEFATNLEDQLYEQEGVALLAEND